jgi:N-acetylglucosamine kinase-like BadF-type ATPase
MTQYFLGVDLGGTKSHAVITDETGAVLGFARGGDGNPEGIGYDGLRDLLKVITGQAAQMAQLDIQQITAAGFGIGGYDWPSQRELNQNAIRAAGLAMPIELVNDAVIGLIAGARQGWGVSIIAGTGCNCWGWDELGNRAQVTGMGQWMGEAAGASELISETLRVISRAWSLRGPQTALTEAICTHVGARDATDLLEGLTVQKYRLKASAAPIVFEIARSGDPVANDLIHWAGKELGNLAVGVIRQLGLQEKEFEVVMAGSFWKGSPVLAEEAACVVHSIAPRAKFVRLSAPPVTGAVLLAMEVAGLVPWNIRDHLIATVEKSMN